MAENIVVRFEAKGIGEFFEMLITGVVEKGENY